jgi:hypothetical protein
VEIERGLKRRARERARRVEFFTRALEEEEEKIKKNEF